MVSSNSDLDALSPPAIVGDALSNEMFAAIRAALDPTRRMLHHDVLVSGVVEILYSTQDLTVSDLTRASRRMWRTNVISEPLVERALHIAREGNAVIVAQDLFGVDRWRLTEPARLIARSDHDAGVHVLTDFTMQIGTRLDSWHDDRVDARHAGKVTRTVLSAIAESMVGLYDVDEFDPAGNHLRPLQLNVERVMAEVRQKTRPKSLCDVAVEIAIAAVDPDDIFGNDIVHLLTVGTILHSFATRRDLPTRPDISGHRVLLDTSVLVGLASPTASVERELIERLIYNTVNAGVEVVVPEHVLEEWGRLFDAAESELGFVAEIDLGANSRLVSNPFARGFLMALEEEPRLDWQTFAFANRDVRRRLIEAGVKVRPHGNSDSQSKALAADLSSRMLEKSRSQPRARKRSRNSCEADGNSVAMVHRWRGRQGSFGTYFISRGSMPGRTYRELIPDGLPIEINPESWLLYLATVWTDDPEEQSRVAEMLAESTIRSSFFGMAAAYTVEDVVELSRRLADNGGPATIEDSRAALQLNLLGLFRETTADDPTTEQRVSAVVQRRQLRATTRLARSQANLNQTISKIEGDAQSEVLAVRSRAEAAEQNTLLATDKAAKAQDDARFWKRLLVGVIPAITLFTLILLLTILHVVSPVILLWISGGILFYAKSLNDYCHAGDHGVWQFVVTAMCELGGSLFVGIAIELIRASG